MKKNKIAFLGCDGSGKSTLSSFISSELKKRGKRSEIIFMGWRNFRNPILKILSKLYLNRKQKKKVEEEKLSRFRERSFLFYTFYYLELWTRYFKVFFSNKDYILFDRYFYDELSFSKGIKNKLFRVLTPRPDLCVILKPSLKTIKNRGVNIQKENFKNFYLHLNNVKKECKTIELDSSKEKKIIYEIVLDSLNT